jgi:hypothetical protein
MKEALISALECVWNAALGEARAQQEGHAVASIIAASTAAMAQRLREYEEPDDTLLRLYTEVNTAVGVLLDEAIEHTDDVYLVREREIVNLERLYSATTDLLSGDGVKNPALKPNNDHIKARAFDALADLIGSTNTANYQGIKIYRDDIMGAWRITREDGQYHIVRHTLEEAITAFVERKL